MSDHWIVMRTRLDIDSLYTLGEGGQYWYKVRERIRPCDTLL